MFETRKAQCLDESGVLFPGKSGKGFGQGGQGSFGLEIEKYSKLLEGARGLWSISCVCLNAEPGRPCLPENYVRVLVFSLRGIGRYPHPGFTITYKDFVKPEILKFSLVPDDNALLDLTKSTHWLNPTISGNPSALIDVGLYHSTFLDQSFSSPTGSNPSIPLSTGATFTSSGAFTISAAQPAATQAPVDINVVHAVYTTSIPEPTFMPSMNFDLPANQPMKIIEHVFNVFETKAKQLVQAARDARPGVSAQNFLSAEITSVTKHAESVGSETVTTGEEISPHPIAPDSMTLSINSDITAELVPPATTSSSTASTSNSPVCSTLRTDQIIRAFQITFVIVIIITLFTFVFVYLFRNPRRRADRAARAEERRRRRLYRRAARQHKWRSWFGRLRSTIVPRHDGPPAETWEEKQLIVGTEVPSLREMRRELRALRTAHTVVDGIVRAEEGRTDRNISTSRIRRTERRTRTYSGSTADSVPPSYEDSVTIVNGFPYTPNGTDSTPDSSVIDTSPRTSIYLSNSDSEKD